MTSPWDPANAPRPKLTGLSPLERERITTPIPLRPTETYGFFCMFHHVACNIANARVFASPYRVKHTETALIATDGVQLDFNDFSGRLPAASAILTREHAFDTLVGLLRAYSEVGGNLDALMAAVQAPAVNGAPLPPPPIY